MLPFTIIKYEHYGTVVSVRQDMKGKHRDHCLCHLGCIHFHPGEPDNCGIAQKNYEFCVEQKLTLPVWECPKYEQKTSKEPTGEKKVDCYHCIHRGPITGSAHSACYHPINERIHADPILKLTALARGINIPLPVSSILLGITFKEHGWKNGWFNWPMNYDPVWLETCQGYQEADNVR